jgi:flavin reductase (DIM6/NTAB) family NADH-FMN oxidoreductase RutF
VEQSDLISPYITNSVIESAVGLVLIKAGEISNAMTVSLFSEVAHHPTALWVSIHRDSYTHSLLREKPEFSLAVLNQTQKQVALACGTVSGRDQNKCLALDLYLNSSGFLFLQGALASTSCRVRQSVDLDDHTLFVADIIEAELESRTSHLRHLLLSDLEK